MSVRTFGLEMPSIFMIYRSSIGKKIIMAVTGFLLIGFVFFHMYGNLKVFSGEYYFNTYAEGLRTYGAPIFGHTHLLWLARIGLIGAFSLHIWAAVALARQARRARPQSYAQKQIQKANYASLTIRWGGLVIFLFLLFHLAHFTWGVQAINSGNFVVGDPYHNVTAAFRSPLVALFYLLALTALGLHLYHGTWSMLQTLGLNGRHYNKLTRGIGLALALVVSLGFASVPIAALLRFI